MVGFGGALCCLVAIALMRWALVLLGLTSDRPTMALAIIGFPFLTLSLFFQSMARVVLPVLAPVSSVR
jgi:hypothetical protein